MELAFSLPEPKGGWESITAAELEKMIQEYQQAPAAAPDLPAYAADGQLEGCRAQMVGLQNKPELNGTFVDVLFYDPAAERHAVRLADGTQIKVKPDNLLLELWSKQGVCKPVGHAHEWKVDQICEHCAVCFSC